jgi:ribosomal protein S14
VHFRREEGQWRSQSLRHSSQCISCSTRRSPSILVRLAAHYLAFWQTLTQPGHRPRYLHEALDNFLFHVQSTRIISDCMDCGQWNRLAREFSIKADSS